MATQTDPNIWHFEDAELSNNDITSPGWYFSDEAEQLHGPYSSRQEAKDMLEGYVRWLNGESN